MKNNSLWNSIYYLIQDDQGFSNLYIPEIGTSQTSMQTIFNSVNKVVKNMRENNINPLSVEIYSGELIQEELLFQMIYQELKP
ncbi:MAG: hypothetical protein ACXACX_05700 [Candidatus Hodarchaeales archaeon]|jgi:hypothetical protein